MVECGREAPALLAVVVRGDTGDALVVTGAGGAAVVTNDAWT